MSDVTMNVYEKLNKARMMFQNANIKKSGINKYAGYTYFELSDILPVVNKICEEVKATCVISFFNDYAELHFVNAEKPNEEVRFTSPMSKATLKGCHDVQNLGAVETYIKRYLYQNCFEIAESDALDATMQPNGSMPAGVQKGTSSMQSSTPKKWTKEQLAELQKLLESKLPDNSDVFTREDKDVFNKMYASCDSFDEAVKKAKVKIDEAKKTYEEYQNIPDDIF